MAKLKMTKSGKPSRADNDSGDDQDAATGSDTGEEKETEETPVEELGRSARKRRKPARFLDDASEEEKDPSDKTNVSPKPKARRVAPTKPVIVVVRNRPNTKPTKEADIDTDKEKEPETPPVVTKDKIVEEVKEVESGYKVEGQVIIEEAPEQDDAYPKHCTECSETYEDQKAWDDHITIWKCGMESCPFCKLDVLKTLMADHLKSAHNVATIIHTKPATSSVKRKPGVFEPSKADTIPVVQQKKEKKVDEAAQDDQQEDICPYCAETMTRSELDVHIREKHEEYVADEEIDYFYDDPDTDGEELTDKKTHRRRRYSGKWRREWTTCGECGMELMKGFVYKHMRQNHEDCVNKRGRKPFVTYPRQCQDCDEVLPDRKSFDTHRQRHYVKKNNIHVVCEHCGRTYTRASLWKHIETIHPEHAENSEYKPKSVRLQPFPRKCDQCDEICDNVRVWDRHKATHRPKKPLPPLETRLLPCPHCAKQMVKSSVDRHIRLVHPDLAPQKPPPIGAKRGPKFRIQWPRSCPDCKQLFDNKIRYDRHRSDGVCGAIPIQFRKNQVCSYCSQRFRRSEIGRHIKLVHCDQLPPEQRIQYPCRYNGCHKIYHKPSSRYSHELTHREEGHNRILQKRKEYRLNKKFLEKTLGFEGIEVQINEGDFRDENGNPTGPFTITLEEVEDLKASKNIENLGLQGLQTMAAIASHLEPSYERPEEAVGETRIIQVPEGDARIIQVPDGDARIIQLPEGDARIIEVPEGDARIIQLPEGDFVQYTGPDGDGIIQYIQEAEGDVRFETEAEAETEIQNDEVTKAALETQPEPEPEPEPQPEQVTAESVAEVPVDEENQDKPLTLSQKPTTLKMMNCRLCNLLFPDTNNLMDHFIKTHTDLMEEVTLTGFELVN